MTRKWARLGTNHSDVFHLHTPVFARVLRTHWCEQELWNDAGVGNG